MWTILFHSHGFSTFSFLIVPHYIFAFECRNFDTMPDLQKQYGAVVIFLHCHSPIFLLLHTFRRVPFLLLLFLQAIKHGTSRLENSRAIWQDLIHGWRLWCLCSRGVLWAEKIERKGKSGLESEPCGSQGGLYSVALLLSPMRVAVLGSICP